MWWGKGGKQVTWAGISWWRVTFTAERVLSCGQWQYLPGHGNRKNCPGELGICDRLCLEIYTEWVISVLGGGVTDVAGKYLEAVLSFCAEKAWSGMGVTLYRDNQSQDSHQFNWTGGLWGRNKRLCGHLVGFMGHGWIDTIGSHLSWQQGT